MLSIHSRKIPARAWSYITVTCTYIATTTPSQATIVGSVHDLSGRGVTVQICDVCHTPHASYGKTPGSLWNHQLSAAVYRVDSTNFHDIHDLTGPPGKELKFFNGRVECPSCHDVHNTQDMDVKLLRKPLAGSDYVCIATHSKCLFVYLINYAVSDEREADTGQSRCSCISIVRN